MIRTLLAGLVLSSCIVGCTRTNAALMDSSIHLAKTCPDGVKLYTSPDKVGSEYTEVALLNSTGSSDWTSESGMMKSMRKKAADVGANGIIMGNINEPSAGAKVAGAFLGIGTERKGKSVAIFVPADSARIREVCSKGK